MVPLHLAVRIVYSALYPGRDGFPPSDERLDGLGQAVIALVPLYSLAAGAADAHRVPESLLQDALVRQGGKEIRYLDGRPALGNLFISPTSIDNVVQLLGPIPADAAARIERRE